MNQYGPYPPEYPAYPPPGREKRPQGAFQRAIRSNANIAGIGVVAVTMLSLGLSKLFQWCVPFLSSFFPVASLNTLSYAVSLFIYCVSLAVPCAAMLLLLRMPLKAAFPLRAPRLDILIPAICICIGARIIGSILVFRVSNVVEQISGLTPAMPNMPTPSGTVAYILYFVSVAVAPAVFEEAMFRGVILGSLRRYGDHFAVIASSILFAFAHGNLRQGPYSLLLGLLIGYFFILSGSIWIGVAIHFVNNALEVLLEYLYAALDFPAYELFTTVFLLASLIVAVIGILYLRMRHGSLFYLRRGDFPLSEEQKQFSFFSAAFILIAIVIAAYQSWRYLV